MRRGTPHDGWLAILTVASRPVPWSLHSKYQLVRKLATCCGTPAPRVMALKRDAELQLRKVSSTLGTWQVATP